VDDTNKLIEQRRENLAALREAGINPFANKFSPSENCGDATANYEEGRAIAVAGRTSATPPELYSSSFAKMILAMKRSKFSKGSTSRISWEPMAYCSPPKQARSA
jgi:lysyl-tRNA synthetase class II